MASPLLLTHFLNNQAEKEEKLLLRIALAVFTDVRLKLFVMPITQDMLQEYGLPLCSLRYLSTYNTCCQC